MGKLIGSLLGVCALLFVLTLCVAYAKPLDSPTLEQAAHSNWIVVADYNGYFKDNTPGYFDGPLADYEVVQVLKGDLAEKNIQVRYDFQDGSACESLEGWEFTNKVMPEKASRWILFLKDNDKGVYSTYRGDYGRWVFSEKNLATVKNLLKK